MQPYKNLLIASSPVAVPFTQRLSLNGHPVTVSAGGAPALRQSRLFLLLVFSLTLLTGFTGCGPPSSDNAPSLAPGLRVGEPPPASPAEEDRHISKPAGSPPAETPNPKTDGPNKVSASIAPQIPDSVAKDLNSPYASLRLGALNHWEANGATAPLDAVFEALQDENEAVQAKAMEIIERRLAAEQVKREPE